MRCARVYALLPWLVLSLSASTTQPKVNRILSASTTQPKVDRILVLKKQHKLLLLNGDQIVKAYSVALGSGGLEPKRRQGDDKTPEGFYRIDYRNPASRFHLALHISYPDATDKEQARKRGVSPGGDIMIHGLGPEFKWLGTKQHLQDWTAGCIAVTDTEIEEIWRLVPDRTPVEIRP
jgi:murein L,D-transpeptidase YafK